MSNCLYMTQANTCGIQYTLKFHILTHAALGLLFVQGVEQLGRKLKGWL